MAISSSNYIASNDEMAGNKQERSWKEVYRDKFKVLEMTNHQQHPGRM
jgi:hypothetical protein